MIYKGYDIDETPFSDELTIINLKNGDYLGSAETLEEAQELVDKKLEGSNG
jgi:hypothetical protein